jgi:hypothetical protein
MGSWFWPYQLGRGIIMAGSVVPVIMTLRLPRLQTAIVTGLMTWILGGAAYLIMPSDFMVTPQRYAHILEIFMQNFSLGVTAVLLIRRGKARAAVPSAAISAA